MATNFPNQIDSLSASPPSGPSSRCKKSLKVLYSYLIMYIFNMYTDSTRSNPRRYSGVQESNPGTDQETTHLIPKPAASYNLSGRKCKHHLSSLYTSSTLHSLVQLNLDRLYSIVCTCVHRLLVLDDEI